MRVTRRQLRRLIREATAPSLESLFGGFYDSSMMVSHAIIKIVKNNPGLEETIRRALEALGPASGTRRQTSKDLRKICPDSPG